MARLSISLSLTQVCDHVVLSFFTLEMLIKMMAMGVWGKIGYLGDTWNFLDFFIVVMG